MPGYNNSHLLNSLAKTTPNSIEDKFSSPTGAVLLDTLGQASKMVPNYQLGQRESRNMEVKRPIHDEALIMQVLKAIVGLNPDAR